jgi:hypothetical protein
MELKVYPFLAVPLLGNFYPFTVRQEMGKCSYEEEFTSTLRCRAVK